MKRIKKVRLPSVETQTVAFVAEARASDERDFVRWLTWNGFYVYLRVSRDYQAAGEVFAEVLMIASIEVPERFRGRGWFWKYCELCMTLGFDALVIESVANKRLRASLQVRPGIVTFNEHSFLCRNPAASPHLGH